jgi:hypothetical protein
MVVVRSSGQPGSREARGFCIDEADGHTLLEGETFTSFILWRSLHNATVQDTTLHRDDAVACVNLAMETFEFMAPDFVHTDTKCRGLLEDEV